ncbi:MAG: outer membrane lipoprotein-sorting protein [Labilithrix sp.]|nr:outer membrane lipoprotein-sorting protein [Labilithrix sp.]MCW5814627.1 outer membrane lipoprotein-sorting protein [Labilithrix sp.]
MKTSFALSFVVAAAVTVSVAGAQAPELTASQIVAKVAESDPWGMGGAEVNAKAVVTETSGKTRSLAFEGKSRKYAPPLGKSVITFSAPADVAGMKFLQVQNSGADDERFLYTPELKRSRRIAGSNRADSFMGTDFSYADLDGRDLRQSDAVKKGDEKVGKFECYHLMATPKNSDAVYGKIELWVRKDNYVPLKYVMYNKGGSPVKTLLSREIQKHAGRWFITGSKMTDNKTGRTTDLSLDKINRREDIPMDNFSVRALEKQ